MDKKWKFREIKFWIRSYNRSEFEKLLPENMKLIYMEKQSWLYEKV